jgi:hypothetical protein
MPQGRFACFTPSQSYLGITGKGSGDSFSRRPAVTERLHS